jgi:hypothetical protein
VKTAAARSIAPQQNHTYTHISELQEFCLWKCTGVKLKRQVVDLKEIMSRLTGGTAGQPAPRK